MIGYILSPIYCQTCIIKNELIGVLNEIFISDDEAQKIVLVLES